MRYPIAAAYDKKPFSTCYSEFLAFGGEYLPSGFDSSEYFFNSGVLVIDLAMWRQENIAQKLEETANKIPGVEDQFLLNMVFYHRFEVLDNGWNFLGLGEPPAWWEGLVRPSAREIEGAQVLHFTGMCKPAADWQESNRLCKSYYEDVYHRYRPRQMLTLS